MIPPENGRKEYLIMRIDKFISEAGLASRSEAAKAARKGNVTLNGKPVKDLSLHIDPEKDEVTYFGETVVPFRHIYLMMNKPEGYVSSTDDRSAPVVLELLPEELQGRGLFPCGRLDKYTVGFLLLTTDGMAAHRMLSPKKHVEKEYRFTLEHAITVNEVNRIMQGINIGGYVTAPCRIHMEDPTHGRIVLTEGKYHEIRRMADAVDNRILFLERTAFAGISLDSSLARGSWRELTPEEMEKIAPYRTSGS